MAEMKVVQKARLDTALSLAKELEELDRLYRINRERLKEDFAEAVLSANEVDITVAEIAEQLDVTRQAIYKVIKEVFGIRHPDKARAGRLGHELKERERGEQNSE